MRLTKTIAVASIALFFGACTHPAKEAEPDYSGFIHIDTANIMIESYLRSIQADSTAKQGQELYSLIMNADELRTYLNRNRDIKNVKFMFAHTMEYINAGNMGKPAGYKSGALTIIVAGYDKNENYIFAPRMTVPDHCAPCPDYCPKGGTASSNLLKQ